MLLAIITWIIMQEKIEQVLRKQLNPELLEITNESYKHNRLLSKPAAESELRGDSKRRTGVYTQVHEDSSTESTQQVASAVGFGKKSNVPSGAESHFKVTIVENAFAELSRIERYKLIHKILEDVLCEVHALSLGLYTPQEWQKRGNKPHQSPPCAREH